MSETKPLTEKAYSFVFDKAKDAWKEYDELAKVHAKMKNDIREIVGPSALAHPEKAAQPQTEGKQP